MRRHGIAERQELLRRSVDDPSWFWDAVVQDLGIPWLTPYDRVLDTDRGIEWATWFTGGRVNVAHACVDVWSEATPSAVAVRWEDEAGTTGSWSYAELRRHTDVLATRLRSEGVGPGDRVGLLLPQIPETVAAVMACSKIGAVWVPIFSGFAAEAIASRLADAGAEVLLSVETTVRKGKLVPLGAVAERAAGMAGCVRRVITLERAGDAEDAQPLDAEPLDAEHPLFIGYTSGTTGRPKGAVHVHGGFLVKVAAEVAYQVDLHADEVLHWVTDIGWIMGPWEIVGALALGSSVLLYEGAPLHPSADRVLSLVERHGVTVLGVSPTLVRAMIASGSVTGSGHDLSSLRVFASTGEPWDPPSYGWLFREVGGSRRPIINISGGTEVGACFLSPLPVAPLKPCTLGGPALGMAVEVWRGEGVRADPGEVGELVCTAPWPGMTRGVWGDPERYLDAYWRRWPGVWVHGDLASVDEDGFWFLHGRSDDTISVAGKRLGPAEVESVLASHPAVVGSAAIGVPDALKGERLVCVVVVADGVQTSADLEAELRGTVAERLGSSFVPSAVVFVDELPMTRSAKIVRRAIRAVAVGDDPGDLSTLENPAALDGVRAAFAGRTQGEPHGGGR